MSIIDKLWSGEIRAFEQTLPTSAVYTESLHRASEIYDLLSAKLDEADIALLEEYHDNMLSIGAELAAESYKNGVKFGANFIIELQTKESRETDRKSE